ncbi:MAG: thioredoxin-disulfide reductase [Anaerolineaceae bacterium]
MKSLDHQKLVILGSGPAGLAAGIYAARADLKPLIFSGMLLYGQVSLTHTIENYPGFPKGIGGMELGQLFEEQAVRFGGKVEYEPVESLDLSRRPFELKTYSKNLSVDAIILAMGAEARKLGVPGEKELSGRGVSYCATCDGWFYKEKDIHVVGGGDSALEESLFLTRFARSVTVIHRRDQLRAGAILENRAKATPRIHFLWDTVVSEIRGEESVSGLSIQNVKTGEIREIASNGVFIFIGHKPNAEILEGRVALEPNGYVRINTLMETNVPGVFAAGEIADPNYRQVITSAGMGAAAAIQAIRYLESQES